MLRRALFAAACVLTLGVAYLFRCQHPRTVRHPLGGRRCADCHRAFADLEDAGQLPAGVQTSHLRRVFSRQNGGTVESTH